MNNANRNTDYLKPISQFLAVVSVVASLLYVGFELRQNTAVARSDAYNVNTSRLTEMLTSVATDQRLSMLVSKIGDGKLPDDFSPEDQISIRYLLTAAVRNIEGEYRSVKEGILPVSLLESGPNMPLADNDFFRSTWPIAKLKYSSDFIEYFEGGAWNK